MPNPSPSPSRFSERKTEAYFDAEAALYRSFWDAEGKMQPGVFDVPEEPGPGVRASFLTARSRLNQVMPEDFGINGSARVLDLGGDNRSASTCFRRATGAHATDIDLIRVRIASAIEPLNGVPELTLQDALRETASGSPGSVD